MEHKTQQTNPVLAAAAAKGIKVAANKASTKLAEGAAQQAAIAATMTNSSDAAQVAIGNRARASAIISRQKSLNVLAKESNVAELYSLQGGQKELATRLLANRTARAERDKTQAELDAIYAREPTGLSLLDGIINGLSGYKAELELSGDQQAYDTTLRDIRDFGATTETIARVQELTKKTVNVAIIEAEQVKIAEDAKILATEAEFKSLAANAQQTQRALSATTQEAEFDMLEMKAYEREANRKARDLQFEQSKKAMAFQIEQYERLKAKDAVTQELEDTQVRAIQAGNSLVSASGNALSDDLIRSALRAPGKLDSKYVMLREVGASVMTGGTPRLGNTPADAFIVNKTLAPKDEIPSKLLSLQNTIEAEMEISYRSVKNSRPKKVEELKAAYSAFARSYMETKAANIVDGESSNPYSAKPFTEISKAKAVQDTVLFTKVLKDFNLQETSAKRIFEITSAAIKTRDVTPEQAANGIVTIFNRAVALNNALEMFARGSLRTQDSYITDIQTGQVAFAAGQTPRAVAQGLVSMFSDIVDPYNATQLKSTRVDLTDYTAVRQALVSRMLAEDSGLPSLKELKAAAQESYGKAVVTINEAEQYALEKAKEAEEAYGKAEKYAKEKVPALNEGTALIQRTITGY